MEREREGKRLTMDVRWRQRVGPGVVNVGKRNGWKTEAEDVGSHIVEADSFVGVVNGA